ncbi:hemolysin family protein [Nitrospina gracilis]|uniref:hemolysin family protein n=1 Tax=Nitrospina gracilis TaxID=35801 RepID=UPI001F353091|nr:hemolysin family protein [Nitrospina gracilis]MCF8720847.1 CBS domain containing-hemolysin-like protein [Nitrospina gracilis Nb-211]
MDLGTTLLLVGVFILLEGFFSGCEIGMISVNRIRMEQLAGEGVRSARLINKLLQTPEQLFAITSLGTNVCVVSSTAIFTSYLVTTFGSWGDFLSMLIISPFILFAGEIIPKLIFQSRSDAIMSAMVYPLNIIGKILAPFNALFTHLNKFIYTKIMRQADVPTYTRVSREQIRHISHPASDTSELEPEERVMIHRIFNFSELTVEQCMVPLVQLYAISDTATVDEANKLAMESGFSRLPVFHERMFNLIGILNTFDLLTVPPDNSPITDLIRPAYYIPPNKKLDDLLKELQQRGLHLAIVVDEHGGCVGIITIEDLLEQIVGEIEDEYDEPPKYYEKYDEDGYLVQGDIEIAMLNEELNLDLPEGDYETVAGLMIDRLEKIPVAGDQVIVQDCRLTVKEASKRKINSVILRKLPPDFDSEAQNGEKPDNGHSQPADRETDVPVEVPDAPAEDAASGENGALPKEKKPEKTSLFFSRS